MCGCVESLTISVVRWKSGQGGIECGLSGLDGGGAVGDLEWMKKGRLRGVREPTLGLV